MTFMDRLPTVISCCFCCFLRAGTIMIAVFSFVAGMLFVPNLTQTPGFWDMGDVLGNLGEVTQSAIQFTLGGASAILCICSFLLMMGVCFNIIHLIEFYQWGAMVYGAVVFVLLFILSIFCLFIHPNSVQAGLLLLVFMIFDVLCTMYFILVANSLRMTMKQVLREGFV